MSKNLIIAFLMIYATISTALLISVGQNQGNYSNPALQLIGEGFSHDIARKIAINCFGDNFRGIQIKDAIKIWNNKHPDFIIKDTDNLNDIGHKLIPYSRNLL